MLSNRRAPGTRPPSRGGWIVAIGAGVVVLLAILAVIGLDRRRRREAGGVVKPVGKAKGNGKGGSKATARPARRTSRSAKPIDLSVEPLTTTRICLVAGGEALVDSQVLTVGATEEFSGEKRYRLDLVGGGTVKLKAGGDKEKLDAGGDASYEADQDGITGDRLRGTGLPVSVRAGIIVTGTEVLTGRVTDRNGPWVSERLGELGCEVAHIVCVGDRPEDLREALEFLRSAAAST